MFIVTNDNSDARIQHLQQQIDELRSEARIMCAEIERLKAAAPNDQPAEFDRREYMRRYMAKRRAEKKAAQ